MSTGPTARDLALAIAAEYLCELAEDADSYDPEVELLETPAGDLFVEADDEVDDDELVDEVYSPAGMLLQGDYWTGPGADDDEGDAEGDDFD